MVYNKQAEQKSYGPGAGPISYVFANVCATGPAPNLDPHGIQGVYP